MKRFTIKLICLFIPIRALRKKVREWGRKVPYSIPLGVIDAGREFSLDFKQYLIQNNMPEKISNLKKGLDQESCDVIDGKIEHFLQFPLYTSKYSDCRYQYRETIYTKEQLLENQKFLKALPAINKRYKGDFGDKVPEVFMYHHGLKFLDKKVYNKLKGKDFLDLGAFKGDSAVIFSEYQPDNVYSFEMLESIKPIYYRNIELNNLNKNKFHFINKGVADKKYTVNINDSIEMANLSNHGNKSIEITSIDDEFKKNKNIGLIQMDIEGAEVKAIKGAINTIKKNEPLLLITIYHTPEQFFDLKPYIDSLDLGYKFVIRNLNFYRHSELETTLICIPKHMQ